MKTLLLAGAILLMLLQETVVRVAVYTRDGQAVVGIPAVKSVTLDTGMEKLEIPLHKLTGVKIEAGVAFAKGRDGSEARGKLHLDSIQIQSFLGGLTFHQKDIANFAIMLGEPQSFPIQPPKDPVYILRVETKDLQNFVAAVDLGRMSIQSSLGTFEIDPSRIVCLQRIGEKWTMRLQDGSSLLGAVKVPDLKMATDLGEVTVKTERIVQIDFREVQERKRPAPPPVQPVQPTALKPAAFTEAKSQISDLELDPEGRLMGINSSNGCLQRWRLPGLDLETTAETKGLAFAMDSEPGGQWVFLVGQKRVAVFERGSLKLAKSFEIEHEMRDVHAIDADKLLVTGYEGTFLLSIRKMGVIQKSDRRGIGFSILARGEKLLFESGFIQIDKPPGSEPKFEIQYTGNAPVMRISPDQRWGVAPPGHVYRIGRTISAMTAPLCQLTPSSSAAVFSPDSKRLYTVTKDGFLKTYDTQDYKELSSHFLGVMAAEAVMEPDGKGLVIAGRSLKAPGHPPVLDLYRFEIPK